jgi:hypothetical protein
LRLGEAVLADLRARYAGCLCQACLQEVAAANPAVEVDR